MYGDNPIRPPRGVDGKLIEIKEIFSTLQGEGPLAGVPAVFVRLGGCNLACTFCDTDFEGFETLPLGAVLAEVERKAVDETGCRVRSLAVITGGEPMRQNIAPLTSVLLEMGFQVQIETNGTLMRPLPEAVMIVCSPKNTGRGYMPLREDVLDRTSALKFLVSAHDERYGEVPELGQRGRGIPIYVQPMDEHDPIRNARNTELALTIAAREGYGLSLQLHKMLRIP